MNLERIPREISRGISEIVVLIPEHPLVPRGDRDNGNLEGQVYQHPPIPRNDRHPNHTAHRTGKGVAFLHNRDVQGQVAGPGPNIPGIGENNLKQIPTAVNIRDPLRILLWRLKAIKIGNQAMSTFNRRRRWWRRKLPRQGCH